MSIADQPSATRQVLPDDELEQAIRWCESARKILKKPAIGSGKRGEMASATKKVTELLEKLQTKRAREYGIFRAQFLNIAEQAETAERHADKNGVLEASAGLSQLAKNLTKLLAQIKEVDASVAKFDDRLRDARIQLTKARNLREATLPESPVFKHLSEAESYYDLAESYRNQAASSLDVTRLVAAKNGLVSLAEQIEQARAAAKVADERAEASAKEMEQFTLAEQAANEAVKELEVLFGAEAQALRIRELLAEARGQIRKEREIWFGHREAIHTLQGVGAVLEEGRNANLELMSNRLPDFVQLQWTQTLELLESMALVAPAHEVDSLREQAARAAESGRLAADQASHDLAEIAEVILQRTSALNEEREQALAAVDELKQVLAHCLEKKLGGPACLEAQRTCDRATDALLPQRRWNEAQRQASAASKELKKWLDAHREFGGEWEQKRSLLQDIIARANRGMLVPVCAVQANQLLIAAEQVLVEFRHADFQAALLAFESTVVGPEKSTLSQADEMLAARLRSLGAAVDDAEYWDEFRRSQGEVARAANDAKGALAGIVYDRKGLEPEQANLLIQSWWDRVDQTVDDWKALIDGLLGDVDRLVEERTLALARLASLAGEARLALRRSSLEELLATLPTREAEPPEPNAAIRKKIVDCLAKLKDLGVDASKELAAWNSLQNEPQADVKEFYRSIRNKLRTAQIERQALRKEFAPELYKMVLDPFVKIPCGDEYRKELERQANDISWLVVSQDPDLIAIAREDMAKLKATLDEVQRDAELHEANKKRLGALGVRIGALMELLPETQRKLYEEHIDLKVAISGVSPRDAAAKIDAFELLIAEAENKTKAREIAIEDYKKLKHDAVERLAKLRKFAAIDPSDRGDAFLTYVEARIEEASDLKAKEDGLVRAIALLERLLEELKSISEAKDKLQRLLELDAKQVNDQRLVKDMATQFDQRKSIFTGITLPHGQRA